MGTDPGRVIRAAGPVVVATDLPHTQLYNVVRVGDRNLIGEVIRPPKLPIEVIVNVLPRNSDAGSPPARAAVVRRSISFASRARSLPSAPRTTGTTSPDGVSVAMPMS